MRPGVVVSVLIAGLATGAVTGCDSEPGRIPAVDEDGGLRGSAEGVFAVPDAIDRPYWIQLPAAADGVTPLPVLLGLHARNGRFEHLRSLTCPGGRTDDDGCLSAVAGGAGFIVVMPSGTGEVLLSDARAWNAGGGKTVHCSGGRACAEGIDDTAYLDAVLDEVARAHPIDRSRLFVTGMGNGAAMAHRVACERSTVYAAVAAVAGTNLAAVDQGCPVARPVPVLQIHGDSDPCWPDDGESSCRGGDSVLPTVGLTASMEGWRQRNGCDTDLVIENLPEGPVDDGTSTSRERFAGCLDDASVELLRVGGGGHAWPGGQPLSGDVGATASDFRASDEVVSFFQRHALPAALLGATPDDGAAP